MSNPNLYAEDDHYAWIIDKDHFADDDSDAAGVTGPRTAPDHLLARLKAGEGRVFRMSDEDGEKHFDGRIVIENGAENDGESETHFAPVLDYGTPCSGATEIAYYINGRWENI